MSKKITFAERKKRIMEGYHYSYSGNVESIDREKLVRSRMKDDSG